jgi:phosphate transport system substrate-binding protein
MKLLSTFLTSLLISGAQAFPSGAGGCPASAAAVAGVHLARPSTTTGELSDGDFTITIDGEPVSRLSTYTFRAGVDHVLKVSGSGFKGFIFRLGGAGTGALTIPDGASNAQISSLCIAQDASGVTHTDPSVKSEAETILHVEDSTDGLTLDVTIVVQNVASQSEFYYSGYTMNARPNAPTAPTPSPASAPTFTIDTSICGDSGAISIAGSSTVEPIAELWAEGYKRACGNGVTVEGGGSSSGARRVCGDTSRGETKVAIGDMSRGWKDSEGIAKSDGFTYDCKKGDTSIDAIQIEVAIDGLSVATKLGGVGGAACIELLGGLSVDQLRWIYSSYTEAQLSSTGWDSSSVPLSDGDDTTHKWSELNFACVDGEIDICGADSESGTYEYFSETIFADIDNGEIFDQSRPGGYFNSAVDEDIVGYIDGNDNAIGYFGYAFFDANRNVFAAAPIENAAGDLVAPTADTVGDGTYNPLARRIFMNVDKANLGLTRGFIKYGFSNAGDFDVSSVGYVPIPTSEQAEMLDRVKEAGGGGGFGGFCFSSENMVDVLGHGPTSMKDLKIGDQIMAADNKYETVFSFGHRDTEAITKYLQIATDAGINAELTEDHMIFSNGKALAAEVIKVGDILDLASGEPTKVTNIRVVSRKGAYAPFTQSGVLSVNGILASSYVNMQRGTSDKTLIGGIETISSQFIGHISQAPHRIVCALNFNVCEAETYNSDGVSNWVSGQYAGAKWILEQNEATVAAILVPAFFVFLGAATLEILIQNGALVLVATMGACYVLTHKTNKNLA